MSSEHLIYLAPVVVRAGLVSGRLGKRAEHAGLAVVEQGVEQRDRAHPVVARRSRVRREHGRERTAEAQADDVGLGCAGDVLDDAERGVRPVDQVAMPPLPRRERSGCPGQSRGFRTTRTFGPVATNNMDLRPCTHEVEVPRVPGVEKGRPMYEKILV